MSAKAFVSVHRYPPALSEHQWADILELLCLTNPDGLVSEADVLDRLGEHDDAKESIQEAAENEVSELPVEPSLDPLDAYLRPVGPGRSHDIWSKRFQDWMRHIEFRQAAFGSAYPFEIAPDGNTISLRRISPRRRVYIFLLLSASLENVSDARARRQFRNRFELVCKVALDVYLPRPAKVFVFGKNPLNKGRYRGTTWVRIRKLAADLEETLVCKEDDFSPTSTGDKGLDLVAWLPHNDQTDGQAIFFGQCGTGEDWEGKQAETISVKWRKLISCTVSPLDLAFIPFCFRKPGGEWFNRTAVYSILFDRLRLMSLLKDELQQSLRAMPRELVERAIREKEPIV